MPMLLILALLILNGTLMSCEHHRLSPIQSTVRTIEISDRINPPTVYARVGDEIRWKNISSNPVRLGFLSTRLLDNLACGDGVTTFFGVINDLVRIEPGKSIQICPVRSGVLQYNVWFDADNPKGSISPMRTVHVEAGG